MVAWIHLQVKFLFLFKARWYQIDESEICSEHLLRHNTLRVTKRWKSLRNSVSLRSCLSALIAFSVSLPPFVYIFGQIAYTLNIVHISMLPILMQAIEAARQHNVIVLFVYANLFSSEKPRLIGMRVSRDIFFHFPTFFVSIAVVHCFFRQCVVLATDSP